MHASLPCKHAHTMQARSRYASTHHAQSSIFNVLDTFSGIGVDLGGILRQTHAQLHFVGAHPRGSLLNCDFHLTCPCCVDFMNGYRHGCTISVRSCCQVVD